MLPGAQERRGDNVDTHVLSHGTRSRSPLPLASPRVFYEGPRAHTRRPAPLPATCVHMRVAPMSPPPRALVAHPCPPIGNLILQTGYLPVLFSTCCERGVFYLACKAIFIPASDPVLKVPKSFPRMPFTTSPLPPRALAFLCLVGDAGVPWVGGCLVLLDDWHTRSTPYAAVFVSPL